MLQIRSLRFTTLLFLSVAFSQSWAFAPTAGTRQQKATAPTNYNNDINGTPLGFEALPNTSRSNQSRPRRVLVSLRAGPAVAEPRTDRQTEKKSQKDRKNKGNKSGSNDDDDYPDMEYLIDSEVSREYEDPFHILLMGSTFDKRKITVTYVSGSLEYVLHMPYEEAVELSQFAQDEGMSCLGTWSRKECLSLGRQLQMRDIVCRVVPYTEGGQRGWQAKDASSSSSSNSNNNSNDAFR